MVCYKGVDSQGPRKIDVALTNGIRDAPPGARALITYDAEVGRIELDIEVLQIDLGLGYGRPTNPCCNCLS